MMRAVVCRGFDREADTGVEDVPEPPVKQGGVRIAVAAAGVSFANLLVLRGKHQNTPRLPFTPGTEVAGTVLECGPGARRFRPGDRVVAGARSGGFAQQAVVPEDTVYALPPAVSFDAGTHFPTIYATAHAALDWRARLRPGEWLLVHGGGGASGLAAIEIGRAMGARVIATAGSADKCDAARDHGAHLTLPADPATLREAVLAVTDGRGVDAVFDPVGGDLFDASLRCVAPEARVIPMGFAGGRIPNLPANIALVKNISVIGVYWGYYVGWARTPPTPGTAARVREAMDGLLARCASGVFAPRTDGAYPLARFREALARLADRRVIGRVVLHPRDPG